MTHKRRGVGYEGREVIIRGTKVEARMHYRSVARQQPRRPIMLMVALSRTLY